MTTRDEEGQLLPARRRTTRRVRPRLLGELLVIAALLVVYDRVRALADVRSSVADSHGWAILDLETALHLSIENALNSWLTDQDFTRMLAVDYYQYMHVSVALAVLVLCYMRRPHVYRPVRNALVLTNVVGLAIFAVYPAAPPRLLPGADFVDTVADAGFGSSHGPIPADQYGALPSLHLAWATWVAVTVFTLTRRRAPRLLFAAYPVVTGIVVVATGNHYVLDVATGILLGLAATWATGLLPGSNDVLGTVLPNRLGWAATTSPVAGLARSASGPQMLVEPDSPDP